MTRNREKFAFTFLLVCTSFLLVSCGGSSRQDPCTTIKVAGGNECEVRPLSVAFIISDKGACSGAFISKRHVVTAAHCIPTADSTITVATQGFTSEVTSAVIHPSYISEPLPLYDVAVLTISSEAPVIPIPLLISRGVVKGEKVVAFGYGFDENDRTLVERVEQGGEPLKATYLDVENIYIETIATISDGGGDTCVGDSGGPLVMRGIDDKYGLIGLVSFGPTNCEVDIGVPGYNTNLQTLSMHDFVVSQVGLVDLN